jgi:hypothetical protein
MSKLQLAIYRVAAIGTVALMPLICRGADFDASDTASIVSTFQGTLTTAARGYVVWGLGILAFFIVIGIGVSIIRKRMAGAKKI